MQTRRRDARRLQANDEVLGGAGDHGPAAGVDGVLVPVVEHAVRVDQPVPDGDQRLHCNQNAPATLVNHHQAQTTTQAMQRNGSRRALPSGLRGSEAKARNGADDRRKKMRTGTKEAEEAIGTVRGME
jgi:hypothetical protein